MPTYQYACTNAECGNRFELVQSFTDPSVSECPVCGQAVRKVYGSVGVVFKGSGFYRTDSRSGSNSSTVAAESAPSAPATAPAATTPTATPASTPASTSTPASAAS